MVYGSAAWAGVLLSATESDISLVAWGCMSREEMYIFSFLFLPLSPAVHLWHWHWHYHLPYTCGIEQSHMIA